MCTAGVTDVYCGGIRSLLMSFWILAHVRSSLSAWNTLLFRSVLV